MKYRGRIAPTPTGYLHLGHASTFKIAELRARQAKGELILRMEDIDVNRCKSEYINAAIVDLRAIDINWDWGPDKMGIHSPYNQSARIEKYRTVLNELKDIGLAYPCTLSRKQLLELNAAKDSEGEFLIDRGYSERYFDPSQKPNWRFDVSENQSMSYQDIRLGEQRAIAGKSFGDFVIWNRDDIPAYELAVVVDDIDMEITEIVRGEDLLKSTFRQICIYNALKHAPPLFYHCPLILDESGKKLAKRSDAKAIRGNEEFVKRELKQLCNLV